jgi:hypothetical protein
MFRHTVPAVALALLMAAAAHAQEASQIVDAPLSALGGDWAPSECADTPDLSATVQGQTLTFEWFDTTGLSDVIIELEIIWRHASAPPCVVGLNGAELGQLTHPVGELLCVSGVVYPTAHVFNSLPGNFIANGMNTLTLTMIGREGAVGICDHPDTGRALRLVIRPGKTFEEPLPQPPQIEPEAPQAILLIDLNIGMTVEPGNTAFVIDLQIVAILADANGDSVRLEIEFQVVGSAFTGVPTTQSAPVPNGGTAAVEMPELPEGEYQTRVRAVDEKGAASEWVPVEAVLRAVGGLTEVRAPSGNSGSQVGTPVAGSAGSDGGSVGSCSAGAAMGPGPIPMIVTALILIGAARRRGL